MPSKPILGWHFCAEPRLANGDGRPVVVGEWLEVEPPIVPCERGLHLSVRAIDALQYAPGAMVQRVAADGVIVEHGTPVDKLACSRRRCLWIADATRTLREFARSCALDVIHAWNAPEAVRRYLETGDESLRAAAWNTARDAAWGTARAAQNMRLETMLAALGEGGGG